MRAVGIFIRTVAHTKIYMRWTTVQNVLDAFAAEVLRKRKAIGYTQRQLADKLHEHPYYSGSGTRNQQSKSRNHLAYCERIGYLYWCDPVSQYCARAYFQKPLWISSPERVRQRFKSMCPCVNKQISWKLINEQPFTKISGCFFFPIYCLSFDLPQQKSLCSCYSKDSKT